MLKNPKLLPLLGPPDNPDGERLGLEEDQLVGAGFYVPVVDGIPDFVRHAPPVRRSLIFQIPFKAQPSLEVLTLPPIPDKVPGWFQEHPAKYWLLQKHEKGVLLDAGAGQGNRNTFEKLSYEYIPLDISFNSQQRRKGVADIDLVADCHRLPIRSSCVECVNITAVLEHLYCPPLALQEIQRILRPAGMLLGSCSFLEGEHFDSQYHHSHIGLFRLLTSAGIQVCHIWPGLSLWEMHSNSFFPAYRGIMSLENCIAISI